VLPEAVQSYTKRAKVCTWHDAMKLARPLAKGKSIGQAIKAAIKATANKRRGTPEGRTAGALKAWFEVSPRKREVILQAASLLGIKLGVKLDA
jgi:hypothetical protein